MISDNALLRRAVANARHSDRSAPRWVAVMQIFGVGSTSAVELCDRFGLNPYEVVRRGKS